ncbi:MAG: GEVED domain-containing protein [Thiolinea sp.]
MGLTRALQGSVLIQLLFGLILLFASDQSFALGCNASSYTYTNNGTSANYSLNSGESLKINSGTYTGTINNFSANSTICVESGASFMPGNLNNTAGTLINYGTTKLQTFSYNYGTTLDNYGLWEFTGGLNFNGATTVRNRANATMVMNNSFQLSNGSVLENDGFILAKQDFNTDSWSTLKNNYRLEMEGNFNPNGVFNNYGRVYSKKFMNANSNSVINNHCTFVSYDGFNNNNPLFSNFGTILITNASGTAGGPFQNNQFFFNGLNAKIAGGNFTNNNALTGTGALFFSGETRNQGLFTGTYPSNPINFYDETQTSNQLFDHYNAIATNTIRQVFAKPTELDAPDTCTSPYKTLSSLKICPENAALQNTAANATSATGNGLAEVENANQAMGTLQAVNTTATASNSAKIKTNGVLTLDLGAVVPADSPILLSLAPVDNAARVKIELSLDGQVFNNKGSFGSAGTLGTAPLDKLSRVVINANAGGSQYVRITYEAGSTWVDGVESLQSCTSSYDYGDAPLGYGVAAHKLGATNLYLGTLPDAESASAHSIRANADGNEDDGPPPQAAGSIIPKFSVLQMTDSSYSTLIRTTNQTGSVAKLSGWIDFDKNGSFDADELASVDVPTGSNNTNTTLTWATIPADIQLGTTYVRLRFTTDATKALQPTGIAPNGEVEDFVLPVHMDIPPNSPSISIATAATPLACQSVVFEDNFNDLTPSETNFWAPNRSNPVTIRNWSTAGGGADTYARFMDWGLGYGTSVYFGNGDVRNISPNIGTGFSFDTQGKLLTVIDAIALRDTIDDLDPTASTATVRDSHWGIQPVTLTRSFATTVGKSYRLYFSALRETGNYIPGVMRVDAPGGSIHFKAPGGNEGILNYAIDFTATTTQSTLSFLNYGHFGPNSNGYCNVIANPWCTVGGVDDPLGKSANELSIDNVKLVEAACSVGAIGGYVYQDANLNNTYDMGTETTIPAITVKLYDEKGTPANTADDRLVATTSTVADGHYIFSYLDATVSYRAEVDIADTELPSGFSLGTTNPLTGLIPLVNSVKTANFGFDGPSTTSTKDYGDAPASYGSAGHILVNGLKLGASNDAEPASQPSFNAFGDDANGVGFDDDGAPRAVSPSGPAHSTRFPVLKQTDTSYTLPYTVTNSTSSAGNLYAWIDFDKNGSFEADEATSVAVPTNLVNGTLNLTWASIPTDIKVGTTFIRVRLTTDATVSTSTPSGLANSGEVEDYSIPVYLPIPLDSQSISVVTNVEPMACQQVVFQDDFSDIVGSPLWGTHAPNSQPIRNWTRSGGGTDTYAQVVDAPMIGASTTKFQAIYFGSGHLRGISPAFPQGFTFDSNGHLTSPIDAIAMRDVADDFNRGVASHWGPEPPKLTRSFATQPGKSYRLYFKAIPEQTSDTSYTYISGVMRVEAPGGSIHFRAPGSQEGMKSYAIEFTATATTSEISFVNYGHVGTDWCEMQSQEWCTANGVVNTPGPANELIIDDVVLVESACSTGSISGRVYTDADKNNSFDSATETGINAIKVSLYDQNGTANNPADDRLVYATDSDNTGAYSFSTVDTSRTYRLEVDTADTHLPSGAVIGTTNPLLNVAVTANTTTANQNFGFDLDTTPPTLGVVGEYRFDDCGSGGWNIDSSGKNNNVVGSAQVLTEDYKNYACTALSNPNWSAEVPHIADYALASGAVSMLFYDHKNVWQNSDSHLLRKGWGEKFNVTLKRTTDNMHGSVVVELNGNSIDTGETFYTTLNNGSLNDTQWVHVVVSFGEQGMRLYVNGVLKGTNTYTGGLQNVQGNFKLPGLEGYFDEFYIFNQQPNDAQVQQLYSNIIANKNWDGSERACACGGAVGDYGDAPASYGSPVHTPAAGIYLGAGVPDTESGSQANTLANGDDNNSNDDEDGVSIYPMWQGVESQISVTAAGTGAYLQAWIDWNADGDFTDVGEQVATNLTDGDEKDLNTNAGAIDFIVTPPTNAAATRTYARFRWSSAQNLNSTSAAPDGEVEDYEANVAILPAQTCDPSIWYGSVAEGDVTSHLRKMTFSTGSYQLSNKLIPPGTPVKAIRYSNLAYRAQDGYLYGAAPIVAENLVSGMVRIGSNGARAVLPWPVSTAGLPVPPALNRNYAGGAFSNSGYFYISSSDAKFYKIDVTTNPPTVVDFIDTVGLTATGPQDFVLTADEKWIYAIYGRAATLGGGTQLVRISLDASTGYPKGTIHYISDPLSRSPLPSTQTGTFGAVYGDLTGNLYGARNGDGRLYRIDISGMDTPNPSATYTHIATPSGVIPYTHNDGASCASELFPLAQASDYSDAPTSYGFAKHIVVTGMSIGSGAPDSEDGALSNANADGDDANGTDDENGVTLPSFIRGQAATISVDVSDLAAGGSYLQGWIDWNADGDFLDADEQIAQNLLDNAALDTDSTAGKISFSVTVPATASTNPTYARFRWSSSNNLAATGAAKDGEVEDYKLTVASPTSTLGVIGEYRFDDCGSGGVNLDSSSKHNNAVGAPTLITEDNKPYACTSVRNDGWNAEVPSIPEYALSSGAVSIWFYDYNSIWGDARLLERGWDSNNKFRIALKPSTEYRNGTVTAELVFGGTTYKIDTGETYYTNQSQGSKTDSQWVNAVVSFGSQGMKLYINGVLKGTNAFTGGIQNALGNFRLPGFEGYYDEFYIINQQPTDAQVMDLYNNVASNKNWDGSPRACACGVVTGDYGDSPLSYGSPVHSIVAGHYLGSAIPDAENASQANANASGDDNNGADDEDGIIIPALRAGQTSILTATVAGSGGYLQAWFDWNADGDFNDSGEQAITNQQDNAGGDSQSGPGSIGFAVNVPVTATLGSTHARFRWSSTAGLDAIAAAANGEVEDYVVNIAAPTTTLSGKVWFDSDNDGIQNEAASTGIEGAKVELYNPATSAVVATTVTDENGHYQFTNAAGLAVSTTYQLRIANFEAKVPQSDWAITSLHTGTDTSVDSDAILTSSYWTIAVTSPVAGATMASNDFGFILTAPSGCLNNGLTGLATESFAGAHSNAYNFVFNNKLVTGYCAERAESSPDTNDSYQVNSTDRQGLTALQHSKLARLYSALQDPDIIFALAPVTNNGKQQSRLDDLMTYMTWYYTYYGENLASVISTHIDLNSNLTADQRTVMKALMPKIIDRVAGSNGQAQYPEQAIYWLWNQTSTSRQDIIVPGRFVNGLTCTSTGTITGKVYKDINGNNSFDSATETGIAAISVALYDQNGTPGVNNDDTLVTTVSTDNNGAYALINIDASKTYRIQVDTSDTDLPAGYVIGTTNPLTNVTVGANAVETDKNFGFDPPAAASISGTVFEDVNYGGGAGRDQTASAGLGITGAKVELYNSNGNLVTTALTTNGSYTFNALTTGDYYVRVVSDTVNSTRAGSSGAELGVLTYRTDSISPVANEVGGHNTTLTDGPANTGAQVLDLTTYTLAGTVVVQNLQKVTVNNAKSGIDFGFNFDTIVNTNDAGQGSLRQFILNANLLGGESNLAQVGLAAGLENSIFMIPGAGPHLITPTSVLPSLTGAATALNAATQAGASCAVSGRTLKIGLDGSNAGVNISGLTIDAANVVVRGFAIGKFTEAGVLGTANADNMSVVCNNLGLATDGSTVTANGTNGLYVKIGASNLQVGGNTDDDRNIVSGNTRDGIRLEGVATATISRNYIGTDASGMSARSNNREGASYAGIYAGKPVTGTATSSAITIRNNLISGNDVITGVAPIYNVSSGIWLDTVAVATITGNLIGTDPTGTSALRNTGYGVYIKATTDVVVGGTTAAERNVISANFKDGINTRFGTNRISILGNYLGTDISGTVNLGNTDNGIFLADTQNAVIGNSSAAGRNIIAGNKISGIRNSSSPGTIIAGNYIGLDVSGAVAMGNNLHGIYVQTSANVRIGGSAIADRNVIAANKVIGVFITGAASNTRVENNLVGLKADGTTAAGNTQAGIETSSTNGVVIHNNVISANKTRGVHLVSSPNTTITNNIIGLNEAGNLDLGNSLSGIDIENGVTGITVSNNTISGNGAHGVFIITMGTNSKVFSASLLTGNRIGLASDAVTPMGNDGAGVWIEASSGLVIGGSAVSDANKIAYNQGDGIAIVGADAKNNISRRNIIYANLGLGIDLNNDDVTTNDAADADAGYANDSVNFPALLSARLDGSKMTIKGCAPQGATLEFYESDITVGTAAAGSNKFGRTKDYGEGQTFLVSLVEGAAADTDTADCALPTDADGNVHTGMKAFSFTLPIPTGVVGGDLLTATATVQTVGTSEFSPTVNYSTANGEIKGTIFEDLNYGGGTGRPLSTVGTVGLNGAVIELYDATGVKVASTTTASSGSEQGVYTFTELANGNYFVRVVSNTVHSSRSGSIGTDLGVQTYRTDGTNSVLNEVGGRLPNQADAAANTSAQVLNVSNFTFADGTIAQSVQPITIANGEVTGVSFGFNFSTVVNTNDAGQGSLRQFLLNNSQLSTTGLLQALPTPLAAEYPAGTETSIFMIPATQLLADKAIISLTGGSLNLERAHTAIDGRTQLANIGSGTIVLDASTGNGLNLFASATSSAVRDVTVSHAAGSGIVLDDVDNAVVERVSLVNNSQYGVSLMNEALNNRVIANTIANNTWAGIAHLGNGIGNTYSQNSIHDNGGLGIDLGVDGVTANDDLDVDTGPNKLLNYPEVAEGSSVSSNGTKVVAYDFDLDVPNNTNGYRVEFFRNTTVDVLKHGEGEIYLGYVDISHAGGSKLNFKGTLNANQVVPVGANIAVTLTEKTSPTSLGSTSEFSGVRNGKVTVCTDLINGTGADMTVNENAPMITYLESTDDNGNPITYVISGGADGSQFIIQDPDPGATIDCTVVKFRDPNVIGARSTSVSKAAPMLAPGDYEAPADSGGDNTYDLDITATAGGKDYVRPVAVGVQDINEPPTIINNDLNEVLEGKMGALNVDAFDPDAGDEEGKGISYALSGGADRARFKLNAQTGELSFVKEPDFEAPLDAGNDNVYDIEVRVMDDQGLSSASSLKIAVTDDKLNDGISLQTKVLLQGPYAGATGLMQDSLRSLGLLPMTQPYRLSPFNYPGTEQLNLDLATVTGKEAIVDWVLIELRDPAQPNTVVAGKAAVVQRDGDVVDASTGSAVLNFKGLASGNYVVSLRHRNHLGVRTANALAFSATPLVIDFSLSATQIAGANARLESGSLALLWSGDVTHDERLVLMGIGSDTNAILTAVLKAPANTGLNSSYRLSGYLDTDLNMDGSTLFMGPGNDNNALFGNVLLFPTNKDRNSNYIAAGSLAK